MSAAVNFFHSYPPNVFVSYNANANARYFQAAHTLLYGRASQSGRRLGAMAVLLNAICEHACLQLDFHAHSVEINFIIIYFILLQNAGFNWVLVRFLS